MPHGCKGSATIKVRVQIPDGIIEAKPQPKAGWQLDTVKGKYAKTYEYYGSKVEEGVKEVVWSGGKLPDDFYDEFVVRAYLTPGLEAGSTLYWPVVQECENGTERRMRSPPRARATTTMTRRRRA